MQTPTLQVSRSEAEPLDILIEAAEIVAGHSLDLDGLLRQLRDLIRKVVDYKIFAVLLKTESGQTLRIRSAIGYRPEVVRNLRVEIGEGIVGAAAESLKTVIVPDVREDPRYLEAVSGVKSEISVPLVTWGELVGVIDLQSTQPNAFGEHERSLLELIGSRFSLAIAAAQSHRATLRQNRILAALSRIAQEFSHILNLEELLDKISTLVRREIPYDAFSILLLEKETQVLKHYFGRRFDERIQWESMPLGKGIVGAAAALGEPVLVEDAARDPRYVAIVEGINSEVAVPLMLKDEVIGVLDLESEQLGAFTRGHVRMLSLLAPQVAIAIDNARLYEDLAAKEARLKEDLDAARELQQHLLPASPPGFEGLEIAARYESANEVSGDIYDFFEFPGRRLGILVGDVSGKGAAAALYGALVSGVLRSLVHPDRSPTELLEAANQALLARKIEARYLTALYAQWFAEDKRLAIANSGLPMPIVCREGRVETLPVSGVPLGLLGLSEYDSFCLSLAPGDAVVFVSDGITESEDASRTLFGEEGLLQLIEKHAHASAGELLDRIFEGARAFSGRKEPPDDRTAIVLKATV